MRVKGTLEYYRHIFMEDGLNAMIQAVTEILTETDSPLTSRRLDNWIKAILYGANKDGIVRHQPPQPDMFDWGRGREGQDKFKFEKRVFESWIRGRNKK